MDAVSGVEPVSGAEARSEYPRNWSRVSRWVRGRACWRCELCGVKNGPPPNTLTVHHLDGDKWNLLPWNLAFFFTLQREEESEHFQWCGVGFAHGLNLVPFKPHSG